MSDDWKNNEKQVAHSNHVSLLAQTLEGLKTEIITRLDRSDSVL